LPVVHSNFAAIRFENNDVHICAGDSGGPLLNAQGHVVGVTSWGNDSSDSNYRPTSFSYSWIFGLPRQGWSSCQWVDVGAIKSHNAGTGWCPEGSFLTQIDLDGVAADGHDAPVVGKARCCKLPGSETKKWNQCSWVPVGAVSSHQRGSDWCPRGTFLTQFDLDGERQFSEQDTPIIGQARCCGLEGAAFYGWGSCYWIEVGAATSHQQGAVWGPEWGFLTRLDFDAVAGAATDSPVVGQAKFCRLGLPLVSSLSSIITFDTGVISIPALEFPNGEVYEVDLTYLPGSQLHFVPTAIRRVQVPGNDP
jgi:hypothetical protein